MKTNIVLVWTLWWVTACAGQTPNTGKQVFENKCAICHGSDANGGEFAPGILTRIISRSDADLKSVITDGLPVRGMPPFKLEPSELDSVTAYLRGLKPPRRGDLAPIEVSLELIDGRKMSGVSVNRTFMDMQVRTADGRVHLLRKSGERYREVSSQVDWPSYDGDLSGNRYSPTKLVNRTNVGRLTPKWVYSITDSVSLETTPIVVEGIMYVTTTNECYALDAGSGREVWRYHRSRTKELGAKVNRGAAVAGSQVFMVTDNAHIIALNRFTGAYARLARLPEPKMQAVRVEDWVHRVVRLEPRVPVCVQPGPDISIRADADQVEQLLINIVRNAADASLERQGRVTLHWTLDHGALELTVDDEGHGISNPGNLFVPFFTTKPGGSGIGLFLSRQIAEAHGGNIALVNRSPGPGCRAVITLPV